MSAITDQPIGWLMVLVAVFTASAAIILLVLALWVPVLWRFGLAWMRGVLPDRSNVVDIAERRRQLRNASGWTRDL